jgi:hypothetical protein
MNNKEKPFDLASSIARIGLLLGTLGLLSGSMLLCSCPGWFLCAGVLSLGPVICGARYVRIAGIIMCIASFVFAIGGLHDLKRERARAKAIARR